MNELISKATVINALKGYYYFDAQFKLPYREFKKDFFFSKSFIF